MAYSVYWEEEIHMLPRGEIVVADDGEKKQVLYRKHFMKFNYIPMSQIIGISSGGGALRIELKDGSEKRGIDYVKFGNMPLSRSELDKCYHKTSMDRHYLGYYIVDEFIYVNDETVERLELIERSCYMNDKYSKKIDDIIYEIRNLYRDSIKTQKVAYEIQNYIFRELSNASNGKYVLPDGVQVILGLGRRGNYVVNCVITDEGFKSLADNNLL